MFHTISVIESKPTTLEITGLSIVLVGNFNPAIFHPHWFFSNGLITETEAAETKDLVVHNELTHFKLPWLSLQVNHNSFIARTSKDSHFEAIRDLVIGVFTLLRHTPVEKLGINLEQHHSFSDRERYREFGHKLAPKSIWRQTLKDPGLVKMMIRQDSRDDGYRGSKQAEVEVSTMVDQAVFFRINDHYEWGGSQAGTNTLTALEILRNHLTSSIDKSKAIVDSLLTIA